MRSWRSSSFSPEMKSRTSSSVASSGAAVRLSRLPSSIGFDPESGSVMPSFTSIARARRIKSQTLSSAMSMPVSPHLKAQGKCAKAREVRSILPAPALARCGREPQDAAVVLVRQEVDEAVWAGDYVADARPERDALLAGDALSIDRKPGQRL